MIDLGENPEQEEFDLINFGDQSSSQPSSQQIQMVS